MDVRKPLEDRRSVAVGSTFRDWPSDCSSSITPLDSWSMACSGVVFAKSWRLSVPTLYGLEGSKVVSWTP